jgi:hypothetical protein
MAASPLRFVVTFSVNPGQLDEVKAVIARIGTLAARIPVSSFTPAFSGVADSAQLTFTFASHDDLDSAVGDLGPELERLEAVARRGDLHVYGELHERATAAFAPLRPTVHAYVP